MHSPEEWSERQRERDRGRERERIMRVGEHKRYRATTVSVCVYVCVSGEFVVPWSQAWLFIRKQLQRPHIHPLAPPSRKRLVQLVPFFSPAHSDERLSNVQPPDTQRNQHNVLDTFLSLFTFLSPAFPYL